MFEEIPNERLTEIDLPSPNASWDDITFLTGTYNGYARFDSFDRCADIANKAKCEFQKSRVLPSSLDDLRTCLFFEGRRWRHFGRDPDEITMVYIHALIEAMRKKVIGLKKT